MKKRKYINIGAYIILYIFECLSISFIIYFISKHKINYFICLIIGLIPDTYLLVKRLWENKKSNVYRNVVLNYARVLGACGPQGSGKTSLSCYLVSDRKMFKDVYSNVPFVINGKYTYKMTEKHLDLTKAYNEYSAILFDEISLYFDNLNGSKITTLEKKQGVFNQFIRHFIDGNQIYTSVNISRMPKFIREKLGACLQCLEQGRKRYLLLNDLYRALTHNYIDLSNRVWHTLVLRDLQQTSDTYNFDLSNVNDKINLANMYMFSCCNFTSSFIYDDRYFKPLYNMPKLNKKWNNIKLTKSNLNDFGVSKIKGLIKGE